MLATDKFHIWIQIHMRVVLPPHGSDDCVKFFFPHSKTPLLKLGPPIAWYRSLCKISNLHTSKVLEGLSTTHVGA